MVRLPKTITIRQKLTKMKNKYLFSLLCGMLFSLTTAAQNQAVTTAILSERDGQLDVAKTRIDQAAYHEKTRDKAKTHFHRGDIYSKILSSSNQEYFELGGDSAAQIAFESYQKAMDLDKAGGDYYSRAKKNLEALWSSSINGGVTAFNNGNFEAAYKYYSTAMMIKPKDSTAYINGMAALTNILAKDPTKVAEKGPLLVELFEEMDKKGFTDESMYRTVTIYYNSTDQQDKAYEMVKRSVKKFPEDKGFLTSEINFMLQREEYDELLPKINKALEIDPTNGSMYSLKAQLEQGQGNEEAAIESYKKAIELTKENKDKSYYRDANFNLGGIYYERARKKWTEAEDMASQDMNLYLKKGQPIENEAKEHFREALPYFETVLEIDRENGAFDPDVYRILGSSYNILKMNEKAKAISDEMEAKMGE